MKRLVEWFIANPIAANILMLVLLIGGIFNYGALKKEVFPAFVSNIVNVSMSYPGAAPSEIEQQIVVRIEEAIANLPGIFQVTSESHQGYGSVNIVAEENYDIKDLLNDVKLKVDSINTFPQTAERPIIKQIISRTALMYFALSGNADPNTMKSIAQQIVDDMTLLEGISEVVLLGTKNDEVAIEVSEQQLRRYNLTFSEVATAIRQSSLNVPAGVIKSKHGDIQIQTRAQAFNADDFASIVVRSHSDGSQLLLGDIAYIEDGFEEQDLEFTINGLPGINFEAKISDDPNLFLGTENASKYLENVQKTLPEGLELKINFKMKSLFDSRFNLLKDNAISGLLLVFTILMLFLRPSLALWVVVGITTTFAGAIWLLPYFDISLNMLSMFAFLMVLGIVVDDAIIIGESVYAHQQRGEQGELAAIRGTHAVLKPVFLAVMSTILLFLPMINVSESMKVYSESIFYVVMLCLVFSLVESMLILPSHLSHMKPEKPASNPLSKQFYRIRQYFSNGLAHIANNIYQPTLSIMLKNIWATCVGFGVIFAIAVSIMVAGWIPVSFIPQPPSTFIIVNASYPAGTPFHRTKALAEHISQQANLLREETDLLLENGNRPFIREINNTVNGNSVSIFVGLTESEDRDVSTFAVRNRLSQLIGPLPEVQSYSLNASLGANNPDIQLNLSMTNNSRDAQRETINAVKETLASYPGVFNVRSNLDSERPEIELALEPNAEALGIRLSDVAGQVRQGFFGEEIQRIPRGKEDVKVMLRYPESERRSLDTLNQMRIRSPSGEEIPLETVADINMVPDAGIIRRTDRRRNIVITADVEDGYDSFEIVDEMLNSNLATWQSQYLGMRLSLDGNLKTQSDFNKSFALTFLVMIAVVYCFFMIAFRSIFQPVLVVLAIPFGFVGAVFGHLLLGNNLSMMSFMGFLACAGVVVNDNLVLLERINQLRQRGNTAYEAVFNAGVDRFRPIVLTSITTFIGLMPILFERSIQAQFLIPMVISLSFGVLVSSFVTLLLVPACYLAGSHLRDLIISMVRPNITSHDKEIQPSKDHGYLAEQHRSAD